MNTNRNAKKMLIRAEMVKAAKAGEFPFYEQFGERVGIWRMRGSKKLLDEISNEETRAGLPDVTFVLRKKTTGYPGQIDFSASQVPNDAQKLQARYEAQKVIDYYCPGTKNPY
jgi:hypothetical protein